MNKSYSKIRHIQESNNILEKRMLNESTEVDEAILDPVKNVYQGLKGVWRGEGYEYYKYMSALSNVIRDLNKVDKPNHKLMNDLTDLKTKINASKMYKSKKQQLTNYIDEAEKYFNNYQTSLHGIETILNLYLK